MIIARRICKSSTLRVKVAHVVCIRQFVFPTSNPEPSVDGTALSAALTFAASPQVPKKTPIVPSRHAAGLSPLSKTVYLCWKNRSAIRVL